MRSMMKYVFLMIRKEWTCIITIKMLSKYYMAFIPFDLFYKLKVDLIIPRFLYGEFVYLRGEIMTKRKMLICIVLMLVLLIGYECVIKFNGNLKKSNHSTTNLSKEKENIDKSEERHDELENAVEDAMLQMEYPSEIPYPGVNQFNVLISFYSNDFIYCDVSADIGKVSKTKINLGKEKLMTYYLPDHFADYMVDVIWFKFYDKYSRIVKKHKIYILYDKNTKKVKIAEQKVE